MERDEFSWKGRVVIIVIIIVLVVVVVVVAEASIHHHRPPAGILFTVYAHPTRGMHIRATH